MKGNLTEIEWTHTIVLIRLHFHDNWFEIWGALRKVNSEDCMINPCHADGEDCLHVITWSSSLEYLDQDLLWVL